jgi:hypothetical protein
MGFGVQQLENRFSADNLERTVSVYRQVKGEI